MGIKKKITEDNYQEVALRRSIIACWIILIICFIVKLFGGNFFEIVCTNENYIAVCDFIQNYNLYYIIAYITYMLTSVLLLLIISKDKRLFRVNTLIYVCVCSVYWVIKVLSENGTLNIPLYLYDILDFVFLYVVLAIFSKRFIMPVIAIILMFAFTLISAITKNIGISGTLEESLLTATIFLIDYYIMLFLTLLYTKKIKKEK